MNTHPPLLAIVGETATGKSSLALKLAQKLDGEIVCADSRTVYSGANIFTATPSRDDQATIPHHLLSIVRPDQTCTAFEFKQLAVAAIDDIGKRGKLPMLVGGSGLYIDAVLFDFSFAPKASPARRIELDILTTEELAKQTSQQESGQTVDSKNRRHMIRFLETGGTPRQALRLRPNTLVIGLRRPRSELRLRIEQRVELMFRAGLRREIDELVAAYGWDNPLIAGGVSALFQAYERGEVSMGEVKRQFVKKDLALAKRQRTWFKRNPYIEWFEDSLAAEQRVQKFLND
jgi:tRNA dimethylallyltransferase